MKSVNNYILLVDNYRRPSRQRNTAGRYRVGAKTEKEAIQLLRDKIKFGSIHLYYKCNSEVEEKKGIPQVKYKEVVKEIGYNNTTNYQYINPISAIAPQGRKE